MDSVQGNSELLQSPLVLWIQTFAGVADLADLADGYLLNKVMTDIDPTFFGMSFVHSNVDGDVGLRVQNLEHLLRSLKNFYQERLQQIIVMDLPNIFSIASVPESEESIQELHKILLLILGCAVQCERKEFFIEKITSLNESIQQELVLHIKEITEQCDNVFAFHPNEIATLSHEELLSCCEVMYDQMIKLVNQRDFGVEEMHKLLVDQLHSTQEVNGNIRSMKSPPLSPRSSEMRLAEKVKFRQITEELDEKDLLILELKDELESNKLTMEKLLLEKKELTEATRWVGTYRDEIDALKIQVEKTKKLESDVVKYKEKLLEMEGVRKRTQELEEQNQILYDTKLVLEKQLHGLSPKVEKLAESEREIIRLKKGIKGLTEEKYALETKHQNALEENARLLLDAQNSLSEVSNLSSEIDMMKDKEDTGICLANECNLVSSTQLLRLEHENHQLKVLVAELTQYKNNVVTQPLVKENAVENGTLERTKIVNETNSEIAKVEVIEKLASITKVLDTKEFELFALQEELKKKEDLANTVSESLSEKEQENKELQDRIQQVLNQKRRTDQLIQMKNEDYTELERRLEEVMADRQKSEENARKKAREMNELNNRLLDAENKAEKRELSGDMVSRKIVEEKNDQILELESRMEEAISSSKKLQHTLKVKDKKIVSLEMRVDDYDEFVRKCDRLTQKVSDKDERIKSLNERLTELENHREDVQKLNQIVLQKDEKIKSLELSLEEVRIKNTNVENELARIQYKYEEKFRRSLQDVDTHKVRRQESVRRREEQIESLQQSKSKLEKMLQAQEGHIQTLQDRLEGSVSERNKLGSSISKKESAIHQLQSKILELEEATTETKKLNELVRIKDESIKRLEDRVREIGLVLSRAKASNHDKDEKIESLQSRVEECNELNKKTEQKLNKKQDRLLKTERDLVREENRVHELETSLEKKNKQLLAIKKKENETKNPEEFLTQSPNKTTTPTEDSKKIQNLKQKLWEADAKIEGVETEKGKLEHQIKRKQTQILELEKKLEESTDALEENERLKKTVSHKEERIRILQTSLEQNQKEINSLESRLENSTSEIYKLRKSDDEKKKRLNSFKMKLDNSDGILSKSLTEKEEEIKTLQNRNNELQKQTEKLNECIRSLEDELEEIRCKKGSSETIILSTLPKHNMHLGINNVKVTDHNGIHDGINDEIEKLEKKIEDLILEKEIVASRCVKFNHEKETLSQELESLRSDYDQLINDLNELKDSYTELDLSSAKSLHRCEMLTQMNSTLEEENRMLMEQMSKLLSQNQELLTESLVSRDQFMEEERTFSDRLYELQRQKEKLEEKIEQANRSLLENTPKKKSNLFKKVLQKAGLKKKKDETVKGKSVQLIKYGQSSNGVEGSSDVDSGSPTIPGVYPLSTERASDSSNISEDTTTENSPDRDLSPLARRGYRVNRAHRSRVARSEYLSPEALASLSMQGRSRSLDAREFIRELVQGQTSTPDEQAEQSILGSSNSMTAIRNDPELDSVDSRPIIRTRSFNLGKRTSDESPRSNGTGHVREKTVKAKPAGEAFTPEKAPEQLTNKEEAPTQSNMIDQYCGVRKASESSRKSSEPGSRSSSLCSGDTSSDASKTVVRHVGSTPRMTRATSKNVENYKDGGKDNNQVDEELRLSSSSGDNVGNEKSKRISRHKTPSPPPRMIPDSSRPRPTHLSLERSERSKDALTRRSSSFAETSPSNDRTKLQRQNSDLTYSSSLGAERKVLVHSKPLPSPTPTPSPTNISRHSSSLSSSGGYSGRSDTRDEQATGQNISIVAFKEVPRVQSAVLESSPQLAKKHRSGNEPKNGSGFGADVNSQNESSVPRGPQTPNSLRRTVNYENLSGEKASSRNDRVSGKQPLWFEYGEV